MLPLSLVTPGDVARRIAERARARRLARGWTQADLAERAGVALPTLRLFERTGRVSLDRLLRVAAALGALDDFLLPFAPPSARSLADIEARVGGPQRQRGRRRARADRRGTDAA